MIDVKKTVISQYANSPTILQLVENMNTYIDPRADFDKFYDFVWNVDTAQGFGLDIWGRIVGIGRFLEISPDENFGFYTGAVVGDTLPFNEGVMYAGEGATNTYRLADDAYRVLILAKALSNVVNVSAQSVNSVLNLLFPNRGRCYANDHGNMTMRYVFEFALEPWEWSVVKTSGVLPRSAGVSLTVATIPLPETFGFAEAGALSGTFNNGALFSMGAISNVT